LAADFDGPSAMLDALSYLKAARAIGAPAALEVSRSGIGAQVWIFFVLASSLRKRAPGYTSLGFPDPRTMRHQPPSSACPSAV
jgi:hypothetical protein